MATSKGRVGWEVMGGGGAGGAPPDGAADGRAGDAGSPAKPSCPCSQSTSCCSTSAVAKKACEYISLMMLVAKETSPHSDHERKHQGH